MDRFTSRRLKALLTPDSEEIGLYPSMIDKALTEFNDMIVWKRGPNGEEIPEP